MLSCDCEARQNLLSRCDCEAECIGRAAVRLAADWAIGGVETIAYRDATMILIAFRHGLREFGPCVRQRGMRDAQRMEVRLKVIYDFGACNGDDISYYLLKSDRVVAVEANPRLCDRIRSRFGADISAGRLIVENCAVSAGVASESVPFYVHRTNDVLSQFIEPTNAPDFDVISVRARPASEIVRAHGEPLYVKIDVEEYDHHILRDLFESGIRPPYLSAESHNIEVFALLIAAGGYKAFKLVDGRSVCELYNRHPIRALDGSILEFSFPFHSAGPFGEDLNGQWMTANNFFRYLAFEGLGWKDVHVSRVDAPDGTAHVTMRPYFEKALMRKLPSLFGRLLRGTGALSG
jgi:FkbM family methyltransferase